MISILLFLSTYAAGFFFALRYSTLFLFTLYQAVYFFNAEGRWWGNSIPSLPYSFIVSVSLLALFFIRFKEYTDNHLSKSPLMMIAWFIMVLFGITWFWSVLPEIHFDAWFNFFKMIIIISVAYKICGTVKSLDFILWGYVTGAAYLSFYINQVGRNSGIRVEGVGTVDSPDANGVAAALAPSVVLCFYYFLNAPKLYLKALAVMFGALIVNALVLINSRASFLAVLASMGLYMLHYTFSKLKSRNQKLKAIGIGLFGFIALINVVDQATVDRFMSIQQQTELRTEEETGSTRVFFWLAAIDLAKDKPLGTGYKGFQFYAPLYIPEEVATGGSRNRSVHSTWFEALSEIGWLGLLLLIYLILKAYNSMNVCKRYLLQSNLHADFYRVIAIQCMLVSYVVSMSFMNRLRAEILYWCVLFCAIAYNLYVTRDVTKSKSLEKNNQAKG